MPDRYVTRSRPHHGPAFFTVDETITTNLDDGHEFVRHVVRHPGGSAVVALIGSEAICVEQYRPAIEQVTLEIPAGRPVPEESPEVTACRELREETGLVALDLRPLTAFYNAPCFCDGLTRVFLATAFEVVSAAFNGDFPTRVRRVQLNAVEQMVADGTLVDAKTILGLLAARSQANW